MQNLSPPKFEKIVPVNNLNIRLDFSLNCKNANVIYIGICKHCNMPLQPYFGQTTNATHIRMSGHRGCFKLDDDSENPKFQKSAFSIHIHDEHILEFGNKLMNFNIGIIKQVKPIALDRAEDFLYGNLILIFLA